MAASIPSTMRALVIADYCKPDEYGIATDYPTPKISKPDEILIRCKAASINPVDVKMASGVAKLLHKDTFPYQIGFDVAGIVVAVGSGVSRLKVGDEVYSRVPGEYKGSVADFVLSTEEAVARKPEKLDWVHAASVPLASLTAFQSLQKADRLLKGGLKGKTILIPGGLSATGNCAVQLAKSIFGAKVITTLSTKKIDKAKDIMGTDYEIIDYTKVDVAKTLGSGRIDCLFDTMGGTLSLLKTIKKEGAIISISTVPSGSQMIERGGMADMPFYMKFILDAADWFFRWWTGRAGVQYEYLFMRPSWSDLQKLAEYTEQEALVPIVGRTAKLSNLGEVREGCREVYEGHGGVGKFVIEID